ncbi:MAG: ATP-binding cassette domain-containing protein [Fibrobacter sp.]|nr:ATP-binding cassette domain-containing protein [Fibrobacter sp.]
MNFKLTFDLKLGEVFGVLAQKNGGKSYLAHQLVTGNIRGIKVLLNGKNVNFNALKTDSNSSPRKLITLIPQNAEKALIPHIKAEKTALNILKHSFPDFSKKLLLNRLNSRLNLMGIDGEKCLNCKAQQLNKIQTLFLVLAVGTMLNPEILLLDECVENLNENEQFTFLQAVESLIEKRICKTAICFSRRAQLLRKTSQRLGVLLDGELIEMGLTDLVLSNPKHPYTQDYLHSKGELSIDLQTPHNGCAYNQLCSIAQNDCKTMRPIPRTIINRDVNCMYAK